MRALPRAVDEAAGITGVGDGGVLLGEVFTFARVFCDHRKHGRRIPRTAVFGAVLWTGYLGGAVATHVRLLNPWFSHILFPLYVALLFWVGLTLRLPALRAPFLPKKTL